MKKKNNGLAHLYRYCDCLACSSYTYDGLSSASEKVITDINSAISNSIGSVYLFIGLAVLSFVLYIAFGRYGNVTLGKASDKPEFNNFSWAAMLFCAGIGSDILYWGVIE